MVSVFTSGYVNTETILHFFNITVKFPSKPRTLQKSLQSRRSTRLAMAVQRPESRKLLNKQNLCFPTQRFRHTTVSGDPPNVRASTSTELVKNKKRVIERSFSVVLNLIFPK